MCTTSGTLCPSTLPCLGFPVAYTKQLRNNVYHHQAHCGPSPRLRARVTQIDWDTKCTTTRPTVSQSQALGQGYTNRLGHHVYHYQYQAHCVPLPVFGAGLHK